MAMENSQKGSRSTNNAARDEVIDLMYIACETGLTNEQAARLEELCLADRSLLRLYVHGVQSHVLLEHEAIALDPSDNGVELTKIDLTDILPTRHEIKKRPSLADRFWEIIRPVGRQVASTSTASTALIVVGTVLMLAMTGWLQIPSEPTWMFGAEPSGTNQMPITIATLANVANCRWDEDSDIFIPNARLHAGQSLGLLEGWAEIRLDDGSAFVLEGPATLVLESSGHIRVLNGKVCARMASMTSGVVVDTPSASVFEPNAEFALEVDSGNSTKAQVFSGQLVLHSKTDANLSERLTAGEAALLSRVDGTTTLRRVAFAEDAFVKEITRDFAPSLTQELPFTDGLRVWHAADALVRLGPEGDVFGWGDILGNSNVVAENAWQLSPFSRPRLVSGGANGNPVVRFNGRSDFLVTTPLKLNSNDCTIVVVGVKPRERTLPGQNGQLISLFGRSKFSLVDLWRSGKAAIVPIVQDKFGARRTGAPILVGSQLPFREPYVLSTVVNGSEGNIQLTLNGERVEANFNPSAFIDADSTDTEIHLGGLDGNRLYSGDLAEVLLFDHALTTEELQKTYRHLAGKYQIDTSPSRLVTVSQGQSHSRDLVYQPMQEDLLKESMVLSSLKHSEYTNWNCLTDGKLPPQEECGQEQLDLAEVRNSVFMPDDVTSDWLLTFELPSENALGNSIHEIRVFSYYTDARTFQDYDVEVSSDGENWDILRERVTNGTRGVDVNLPCGTAPDYCHDYNVTSLRRANGTALAECARYIRFRFRPISNHESAMSFTRLYESNRHTAVFEIDVIGNPSAIH